MSPRTPAPALLLCLLCWLTACASAGPRPVVDRGPPEHSVHVVRHGWHTGIVVDRAALAATGLVPEVGDFAAARSLEFGWGDRTFYTAPAPTVPMALRAALVPTAAVLHVAPAAPPDGGGASPAAVEIAVSDAGFRRLAAALSAAFDRPPDDRAEPLAPRTSAGGRFYPARGTFHVFNTCNTWVVRTLAAAGLDVAPGGVLTAGEARARGREAARQRRPEPGAGRGAVTGPSAPAHRGGGMLTRGGGAACGAPACRARGSRTRRRPSPRPERPDPWSAAGCRRRGA